MAPIHPETTKWSLPVTAVATLLAACGQTCVLLLCCVCRRDVHLQIIYFGREHCPAKQHDPKRCPICSWAATGAAGSSTGSTDDIAPAASKKPTAVKKRKATAAVAAATADVAGQAAAVAVVVTAAGEGSSGVAAAGVGQSSRRRSTRARKQ